MKPGKKKKLVGKQHELDKNKDGEISGEDFKMMAGGGSMKDKINEAMGYKKGGRVKAKKVGKEKSYKAKSIGGKMSKARGMGAATKGGKFQGVF